MKKVSPITGKAIRLEMELDVSLEKPDFIS